MTSKTLRNHWRPSTASTLFDKLYPVDNYCECIL